MAGCSPSCRRAPAAAGPCSYIVLPASVCLPATPRPSFIMLLMHSRTLSLMLLQPLTMCACFAFGAQGPQWSFIQVAAAMCLRARPTLPVRGSQCARLWWSLPPSDAYAQQWSTFGALFRPFRRLTRAPSEQHGRSGTPCDCAAALVSLRDACSAL